ncbi:MAG: hypothetical protein ACAH18_09570 [Methylophilaceae bacterium]
MSQSLESRVLNWLTEQGFPLEMEVASMAKATGFEVSQSDYYLDPESGDAREIDLVLSVHSYRGNFSLTYNLFVECKSSRDKPWLLFCTPNEIGEELTRENRLQFIDVESAFISNDLGGHLLLQSTFNGNLTNLFPRLNTQPLLGYGITQAFAQAGDAPFKAMMSATKAALSHTKRMGTLGLTIPFLFSTPVVVIDVPLLAVSFSSDTNELNIAEIPSGNLFWKHVVDGRSRIGVYVVTKQAFPEFLARCYASAKWWTSQDEEALEPIRAKKYGPRSPQ